MTTEDTTTDHRISGLIEQLWNTRNTKGGKAFVAPVWRKHIAAAIQRERDRAERAERELKANEEYHSDCMNKIDEALGYPRDLSGALIDEFVAAINLLTMAARIRRGEA